MPPAALELASKPRVPRGHPCQCCPVAVAFAGGIEGLGDRDEGHPMFVKQLDQLGEIGEGAGEAIDLIDHNDGGVRPVATRMSLPSMVCSPEDVRARRLTSPPERPRGQRQQTCQPGNLGFESNRHTRILSGNPLLAAERHP
jgi:hypothetical protein